MELLEYKEPMKISLALNKNLKDIKVNEATLNLDWGDGILIKKNYPFFTFLMKTGSKERQLFEDVYRVEEDKINLTRISSVRVFEKKYSNKVLINLEEKNF